MPCPQRRAARLPRRKLTVVCILAAALFICSQDNALSQERSDGTQEPLRTGIVVSVENTRIYTFAKAFDAAGKVFWVAYPRLPIREGDTITVLKGSHYDELTSESLGGRTLRDFYGARAILVNGFLAPKPKFHSLHPSLPRQRRALPQNGSVSVPI